MSDVPMVQHALLLRVPPTIADSVRKQLGEKQLTGGVKDASGGGSMRITFTTQEGQMQMQMGTNGATLQGQLVNLPSIIEVQKTFDQIHYYKVADIGQVNAIPDTQHTTHDNSSYVTHVTKLCRVVVVCVVVVCSDGCGSVSLGWFLRCFRFHRVAQLESGPA